MQSLQFLSTTEQTNPDAFSQIRVACHAEQISTAQRKNRLDPIHQTHLRSSLKFLALLKESGCRISLQESCPAIREVPAFSRLAFSSSDRRNPFSRNAAEDSANRISANLSLARTQQKLRSSLGHTKPASGLGQIRERGASAKPNHRRNPAPSPSPSRWIGQRNPDSQEPWQGKAVPLRKADPPGGQGQKKTKNL